MLNKDILKELLIENLRISINKDTISDYYSYSESVSIKIYFDEELITEDCFMIDKGV